MASAASATSMSKGIDELTECVICAETFTSPKVLPCQHSFCLKCLQAHGKDNIPGDQLPCPLCRTYFTILQEGFEGLPNNYFVNKLLIIRKTSVQEKNVAQFCDLCLVEKEVYATSFCVECGEHLCETCSKVHRRSKSTTDHKVVGIDDKPSSEELLKIAKSYCEEHKSKEIDIYCFECKVAACIVCFAAKHKMHKCTDINESGELFKKQLSDDVVEIVKCIAQRKKKMGGLAEDKRKFLDSLSTAVREISKRYNELRSLIDLHQKQLMDELDEIKVRHLKEIEMRRDEDERQLLMSESYKRYCEEMKEKATACDISRAADDLHLRAVELIKSQEKYNNQQMDKLEVSFKTAALITGDDVKKLFGTVQSSHATKADQLQSMNTTKRTDCLQSVNTTKRGIAFSTFVPHKFCCLCCTFCYYSF